MAVFVALSFGPCSFEGSLMCRGGDVFLGAQVTGECSCLMLKNAPSKAYNAFYTFFEITLSGAVLGFRVYGCRLDFACFFERTLSGSWPAKVRPLLLKVSQGLFVFFALHLGDVSGRFLHQKTEIPHPQA
jgi:hypothetical protein